MRYLLTVGLARAGYPVETCRHVLLSVEGDEYLAAERLFRHLLGLKDHEGCDKSEEPGIWNEEQTPLKEIYGSRFQVTSPTTCRIHLTSLPSSALPKLLSIEFTKPSHYPHALPPHMVIISEPKLPSHVRLSLLRRAGLYAWDTLRGTGMVWSLADWIEENLGEIVKHPGRLSDLDGVVSGEITPASPQDSVQASNGLPEQRDIDWIPRAAGPETPVSESRKLLPAWKHRDELVAICRNNRVIVVTGETGSGKSTQVPQYLLDDFLSRGLGHAVNIVCTQPRRISAIGLADRVSDERQEKAGMTIGYNIRGETRVGASTKLRFVTTGVLLRRFLGDPDLSGVTHVIVDEVHERTVDGDFLLLLLKDLLSKRKDITVILMSATVEAEEYSKYFSEYAVGRVQIEGRTFPVKDIYVDSILRVTGYRPHLRRLKRDWTVDRDDSWEDDGLRDAMNVLDEGILDYELIAKTVELIYQEDEGGGGVLIFLPGSSIG